MNLAEVSGLRRREGLGAGAATLLWSGERTSSRGVGRDAWSALKFAPDRGVRNAPKRSFPSSPVQGVRGRSHGTESSAGIRKAAQRGKAQAWGAWEQEPKRRSTQSQVRGEQPLLPNPDCHPDCCPLHSCHITSHWSLPPPCAEQRRSVTRLGSHSHQGRRPCNHRASDWQGTQASATPPAALSLLSFPLQAPLTTNASTFPSVCGFAKHLS